ncbi:hypothetical protein SRHO_G00048580 [Serrasalmus rhombeus]
MLLRLLSKLEFTCRQELYLCNALSRHVEAGDLRSADSGQTLRLYYCFIPLSWGIHQLVYLHRFDDRSVTSVNFLSGDSGTCP